MLLSAYLSFPFCYCHFCLFSAVFLKERKVGFHLEHFHSSRLIRSSLSSFLSWRNIFPADISRLPMSDTFSCPAFMYSSFFSWYFSSPISDQPLSYFFFGS